MTPAHADYVDAWWAGLAAKLPRAQLLEVFERALAAVWSQSRVTLGEITLRAIANRVLKTQKERFPWLAPLRAEASGISLAELREVNGGPSDHELAAALRALLVDLLSVIGNLTSEILTPELHGALAKTRTRMEQAHDE